MLIYPAVDIRSGRCVRLFQGQADRETVYAEDPVKMARRWAGLGASWLHVIDLDGAFAGEPVNHHLIGRIADETGLKIQAGGGVRKLETIETLLAGGISRVIVGSRAVADPDFARAAVREYGRRVIPSIDSRGGTVLIQGWVEQAETKAVALGKDFRKMGFRAAICTDVSSDGTLSGPDLTGLEDFLDATGLKVIAAGGIATLDDLRRLQKLEAKGLGGAITGKGLYDGTLDLGEALSLF